MQQQGLQKERYSRQLMLPEVGEEGQRRLSESVVAIVGLGGLGSCVAELLARAGVGGLILIDHDAVELSNLQRQSLYEEADVGRPKANAAADHLQRINKDLVTTPVQEKIDTANQHVLDEAKLILDCTDNLETRRVLNTFSLKTKIPFIYCAAIETRGMVYVVEPKKAERACFECVFESLKSLQNAANAGILNTTVHLAATLEVAEAMKLLLGKPYTEGLISFDVWEPKLDVFKVKRRADCTACSTKQV
jgi:molybdopterin-synthase adenylyltransferase